MGEFVKVHKNKLASGTEYIATIGLDGTENSPGFVLCNLPLLNLGYKDSIEKRGWRIRVLTFQAGSEPVG